MSCPVTLRLQANWDLYRAAKAGFAALADDAKSTPHPPKARNKHSPYASYLRIRGSLDLPGPPALGGWDFWEGFLRDPLNHNAAKLKLAAKAAGLMVSALRA